MSTLELADFLTVRLWMGVSIIDPKKIAEKLRMRNHTWDFKCNS